jgi:hypothetical protein
MNSTSSVESAQGHSDVPAVATRRPYFVMIDEAGTSGSPHELVAYEEFAVTENESERTAAGKRHMESIKGLSGKNYQSLYTLNSLDFVLLFVPIEPAFMRAVASDRDLLHASMRSPLMSSKSAPSVSRICSPPVRA